MLSISNRLEYLQAGKRKLKRLELNAVRIRSCIWECQSVLKHEPIGMVSCGSLADYRREHPTDPAEEKIRESERKLYAQMIKPYGEKLEKNNQEQESVLKWLGIKREWDSEGYELTYDFINARIKELKNLIHE